MKNPLSRSSWPNVLLVALVAVTTTGGCRFSDDLFGDESYRGMVSLGFEVVSFIPCNRGENWWMTGSDELRDLQLAYFDLVENHYEPAFARIKGRPSGLGEYGHVGAYQREFEVEEVVELRLPREGECGWESGN